LPGTVEVVLVVYTEMVDTIAPLDVVSKTAVRCVLSSYVADKAVLDFWGTGHQHQAT
jgi:hypothetical protein